MYKVGRHQSSYIEMISDVCECCSEICAYNTVQGPIVCTIIGNFCGKYFLCFLLVLGKLQN